MRNAGFPSVITPFSFLVIITQTQSNPTAEIQRRSRLEIEAPGSYP